MSDKVRLGFVGGGTMGQLAHIANYALLRDQCELVAIAELRPQLAQEVAARYGIAEVYADHRELLADADVDAVVAIMPYALHHTTVPDVLQAGKHLLTEKPIGCQPETARQWAALAGERNLVYLIGYMKRWDPASRYVADLVRNWRESGECGRLTYLHCVMSGTDWTWNIEAPIRTSEPWPAGVPAPVVEEFPAQLSEAEAKYYNRNINFFVHQINLIRFLLGEDYELTFAHPSDRILIGTTAAGVPLSLEMASHRIQQTWDETYRICFEGAEVELRMPAPLHRQQNGTVTISRNAGDGSHETLRPNFAPPSWCFLEQARGFLQCVRDGRAPHDSAGEAVRDLEIFLQQVELMRTVGATL